MFCSKCGNELEEGSKACSCCGTIVGEDVITVITLLDFFNTRDTEYTPEQLPIYLKAAEQGDMNAQYKCGVMYDGTEGIAEDAATALHWYRKAAEQGHVPSQYNCGLMYDAGEGMSEDKKEALYWYRRAAGQGDADAQFKCGMMYEKGEGTGQDWKEALNWYRKAAAQGHIEAKHCMQEASLIAYSAKDAEKGLRDSGQKLMKFSKNKR